MDTSSEVVDPQYSTFSSPARPSITDHHSLCTRARGRGWSGLPHLNLSLRHDAPHPLDLDLVHANRCEVGVRNVGQLGHLLDTELCEGGSKDFELVRRICAALTSQI